MIQQRIRILVLVLGTALAVAGFRGPAMADQAAPLVITPGMQYDYALSLFGQKDYATAQVEFKRFLHFFPHSPKTDQARFHLGICLYELKSWHNAAQEFNTIIVKDEPGPVTREAYFFQSLAFEKMGNIGYAQIVLQNFLKLADDGQIRDRINYHLGRLFLRQAREGNPKALERARQAFGAISDSGFGTYQVDQYLSAIRKVEQVPKKDPVLAGLLAGIPGGGFAYCGRYKDAFTTFLINTGLLAAAWKAWDNGNEPLACVIGFVETGFYTGNIYGSISSAHKHNRAQAQKILNQSLSIRPVLKEKEYGLMFDFEF